MNYREARKQLAKGKAVKRPLWITRLIPHPQYGADNPLWDLPKQLHDEYPNRSYRASGIDADANDWEIAA